MNKRIIAAMASMFLFTFVAKAELMDLGIKLHTAVWAPRTIKTTREKTANTAIVNADSYYYYDGGMSGFINGRYGLALEPTFNIGYGIKLGIGAGVYWDPMAFSAISRADYNADGSINDANTVSDGTYIASSPERQCMLDKAKRISIIPELLVRWEFIELDPVSFYFTGRAGLSFPMAYAATLKYDNLDKDAKSGKAGAVDGVDKNLDAETLNYSWLSNLLNFEAGFGVRWLGMEAELLGGMFQDAWEVTQTQPSYYYSYSADKGYDQTKISDAKSSDINDTRLTSIYTYGVMLQLGYNLELF